MMVNAHRNLPLRRFGARGSARRGRAKHAGMTLIEILVVLTLIGVVLYGIVLALERALVVRDARIA